MMGKKDKTFNNEYLLPINVIKAASKGDIEAIDKVLKHYEGYIAVLSTRKLYDEYGNTHYCVDESLRRRLETKLITKVLNFKIA
ncbi:Helix-turn-helix domain protein [Eubacteriaceae bacterium CHKCI004]|nr:Helix-turn-helix domain protein [Eubacteriaceae bacterium CHKCI004]